METYKVVVIDDDENITRRLGAAIRKEGCDVFLAGSGEAGLQVCTDVQPDIVITDLNLPGINGLEVVQRVKSQFPYAQVILVTAWGEIDVAIKALQAGVLDYLKKPIDLDHLFSVLDNAKKKIEEERRIRLFPSVLVVDDDENNRKFCVRAMEGHGWTLFQARDGEEALEIFRNNRIDVVLLDIMMPKKDGLETLHDMRNITCDFEPIIMTGYGNEEATMRAIRHEVSDFLIKPVSAGDLLAVMEKTLERQKLRRALKYRNMESDHISGLNMVIAKIADGDRSGE